jgi:hypothetical protein
MSEDHHDALRPYPRLTEAQKDRMLADLLQEYRLNNLRPAAACSEARNAPPQPRMDAGAARGELQTPAMAHTRSAGLSRILDSPPHTVADAGEGAHVLRLFSRRC